MCLLAAAAAAALLLAPGAGATRPPARACVAAGGSCARPSRTGTRATGAPAVTGRRFASTAAASALATATTLAQAEAALQSFLGQYGLTAEVGSVDESAYARAWDRFDLLSPADLPALRAYGAVFVDEWAKYPLDWVRASGVRAIAFVKDFATQGVHRAAGPDPFGETMYYDVPFSGSGDYAREVIHHEFDHLVTYHLFGSWAPPDPAWTALDPPGFAYGSGGASCYAPGDPCAAGNLHPQAGFVTGYARSALEEDEAEVYAYLMTASGWHRLKQWMTTDPALAGKVALMEGLIARYSPEMSGAYFDQIDP